MALAITKLSTGTVHPDQNTDNHTIHYSPFSGARAVQGPFTLARISGTEFSEIRLVASSSEMSQRNPLNSVLEPLMLTAEEAAELRRFLAHPTAFPRVPIRSLPERDRTQPGQ